MPHPLRIVTILRRRGKTLLFCTNECTENPGSGYKEVDWQKVSVSAPNPPKCIYEYS
jgi:hypothetical protein